MAKLHLKSVIHTSVQKILQVNSYLPKFCTKYSTSLMYKLDFTKQTIVCLYKLYLMVS